MALTPLWGKCSGVDRGGAEEARAPPEFGRSVNPIQTEGPDYTPHTTASPPGFKKLSTSLSKGNIFEITKIWISGNNSFLV